MIYFITETYLKSITAITKNVDVTKYAKIDTYNDNSTKSIDKQIERLNAAYNNEVATQKENLKQTDLLQKRSIVNVIGNTNVKENRIEIQRYDSIANAHYLASQSILNKIQKLENQKAENVLVLKDMNKAIESDYKNEVSFYENIGILKGCLLEILLFLFITGSHFLDGIIQSYNTVKSKVSINEVQKNKTIQQTASKPISLPKAPKVRIPKLKKSVKDKISSRFKTLNIFEDSEVVLPTQNKVDLSSMIDKDIEISEPKELSTNYTTIWSAFKDLGLKSGLITKYTQLKKQDLQNLFRFVVDLDVKNSNGKEMNLESFASMIEGVYENRISAKDLESEVKIMKSNFINKDRITKSKMLKVSGLENEILMSSGQKTLF